MEQAGPGRRERKKEQTRRRIVDNAMRLFEANGFESVTMEQIAEAADVARGTLYNHFPAKEAILSSFVQKFVRELSPEVDRIIAAAPDTRARLVAYFQCHARWVEDRRELMEKYVSYRISFPLRSIRDPSARSGFEEHAARLLALGQEAGDVRQDVDVRALSSLLTSIYTWAYFGWLAMPDAMDLDRIIGQAVDLFLDGAAARSGGGPGDDV